MLPFHPDGGGGGGGSEVFSRAIPRAASNELVILLSMRLQYQRDIMIGAIASKLTELD